MLTSIVEERLKELRSLSSDDLSIRVVARLVAMSVGGIHNRAVQGSLDYTSKRGVANLIRENLPVLERWPDTSKLESLLGIKPYISRKWPNTEYIRKRINARKAVGKAWFDPKWVKRTKRKMRKVGRDFITVQEASEILDLPVYRITRTRVLPSVQPAGPNTLRLYPRQDVESLAKILHEIEDAEFLTTDQVSTATGAMEKDVRKWIPHKNTHPITRAFLYNPSVVEKYSDAVFVRCSTLHQVLEYCDKNIGQVEGLRARIRTMIIYGLIPSEKDRKYKPIFISKKGEVMILNLYKNFNRLKADHIQLHQLSAAARKLRMSSQQLGRLVNNCGSESLLSGSQYINNRLQVNSHLPIVPYVRYTEDSPHKYLTCGVIEHLQENIRKLRKSARKERFSSPFHARWYQNLAEQIRHEQSACR